MSVYNYCPEPAVPKSGTRNPKPETRNPKPETLLFRRSSDDQVCFYNFVAVLSLCFAVYFVNQ